MIAPPASPFAGLHLAVVRDNADAEGRGRLQVEIPALGITLWASCATASAGRKYGVQLLPRKEEVVIVGFVAPEFPVVLGALWAGSSPLPDEAAEVEDRYCLTTPQGTVWLMDDKQGPRVRVVTPAGNELLLTDDAGGQLKVDVQGTTVTVTPTKVEVQSSATVEVTTGQVKVSAGMVKVDAGMVDCSGVVKCSTLIADAVVSTSYTPGAGNVW